MCASEEIMNHKDIWLDEGPEWSCPRWCWSRARRVRGGPWSTLERKGAIFKGRLWFHVDATQGPRRCFDAIVNLFWFRPLWWTQGGSANPLALR